MILNINKNSYEVKDKTIVIKRDGVATKVCIPNNIATTAMDDTFTNGVVITPSPSDLAIHFEEPTSEEYGTIVTNNFGIMLGDKVSADVMTVNDGVYIEVYEGNLYFKNENNEVFFVSPDGKVKRCKDSDKIYWIDNAVKYITNSVGRVLELQYSVTYKEDAVNNSLISLSMSVEKNEGHLTIYTKIVNVNVAIGLGEFTLKKGVNRDKFNMYDTDYFDDDIDIEDEDNTSSEEDDLDYVDDDVDTDNEVVVEVADDTYTYVDDDFEDEYEEDIKTDKKKKNKVRKDKLNRINVTVDRTNDEDEYWQ